MYVQHDIIAISFLNTKLPSVTCGLVWLGTIFLIWYVYHFNFESLSSMDDQTFT